MKKLCAIFLCLVLLGCAGPKEIVSDPVIHNKPALELQATQPASQAPMHWIVINQNNAATILGNPDTSVVYALTPEDFQKDQENQAELRKYITTDKAAFGTYKQYYEPKEGEKTKDGK